VFFVDTRYGQTHVIASGDPPSPPLMMTHPMGVGGFAWSSIIAALSEHRRAYSLDTIGDVGKSVLADPDLYPKNGCDYSAWLDDGFTGLSVTSADMVGVDGWVDRDEPCDLRARPPATVGPARPDGVGAVAGHARGPRPVMSQRLRPTAAKLDAIITRSLGPGEQVNREFRPWMRIMGYTKARVGQPFHIPARQLRMISAPTLLFFGGKDGLVGSVSAAARGARRNITGCEIEVLPNAGHVMSVDEPDVVGPRIVEFLR
jgi:pimeloyl-ACP methyl ester carboxylesterase